MEIDAQDALDMLTMIRETKECIDSLSFLGWTNILSPELEHQMESVIAKYNDKSPS